VTALRYSSLIFALGCAIAVLCAPQARPKERVVNYYNWSDYQDPTILDTFTKETGIKVRYDTFDSNDTLEAKLLAGSSGYDVVVPSAYFLARQISAGIFQKLDKSKLPNLPSVWPEIASRLAFYDPGNRYAIDYMWGTTGIGYNVKKVKEILGAGAVIDSWDDVFNPDKISKFKNCGIHLLDSSDDIMSAGLHYLHLDPNTAEPGDLQKVTDLLLKIRPYVRKFHSSEYLNALATGEICFVVGYSGDIKQAQTRAAQASSGGGRAGIEIGYSIPKEGAQLWFDTLAIPKDAPDPQEAHELINYLIKPEVAAKNTNYVSYANGDSPSQFIDKSILDDRTVYPDADTMAKFYTIIAHDGKTQRLINRLWTKIKTGE
jgi:putrescine transport system substrate-binding protein